MNIVSTSLYEKCQEPLICFILIVTQESYVVDLVVRMIEEIPPDITIHRLTGDVPRKLLISPEVEL